MREHRWPLFLLLVGMFCVARPEPVDAFRVDRDLGINSEITWRCAQPSLAPELVISNCMFFLRATQNSGASRAQKAQALYFLGTAQARKGNATAALEMFQLAQVTLDGILGKALPENEKRAA